MKSSRLNHRIHRDRYVGSLFVANQWYLSVCHEVHIYIKGWLPSI